MPRSSQTLNGSFRIVSAIATESSGAVPIRIAARDGPASRIATIRMICAAPGAMSPASTNFQRSAAWMSLPTIDGIATTALSTKAIASIATAPAYWSTPRVRPKRTDTSSSPNVAPASAPNRTASTV